MTGAAGSAGTGRRRPRTTLARSLGSRRVSAVRERRVEVRGIGAPVLEAGPANQTEAVVFMHGNPGSGADWRALLAATGDFARAVAPDLPNYGRADRSREFDATLAGYARWLGGALGELGIERAHLVLHDWGGSIGLTWAAEHPERVASLSFCNIGVQRGYRWHSFARLWRVPMLGELLQAITTPKVLVRAMTKDNPRLPRAAAERMAADNDRGTKRAALSLYRSVRFDGPEGEALADHIETRLRDVPVNVLWGAKDPYIGVEFAEAQRATWPHAAVTILPEAGHWVFLDEPARAAEVLLPFLREQAGAGDAPPG